MKLDSLYGSLVSIGMSKPYASQISRGVRQPSLTLAIHIYRELGLKIGPIKSASSREIETLEKIGAKRMAS